MRSNPGGEVIVHANPKKKRKRRSARRRARARRNPSNPRPARRRRRYRRNPAAMALPGGLDLGQALWGVGGALASDIGGNLASKVLPANLQTPFARFAVKGGLILLGSMLLGRFVGRAAARTMALGGAILVGVDAARQYVLPNIPGLQGYLEDGQVSGYMLNGLGAGDGSWASAWSD